MRILFLGDPDSANTLNWIEGLRTLGCEVLLATVRASKKGVACHVLGCSFLPPRLKILTGIGALRNLIRDVEPDLIIAYRVTSYGFLAARTGFHPFVVAAQNERIVFLPEKTPLRSAFLGWCAKFALKNADLAHAWSENIAEGLMAFGMDKARILTLHRGIDIKSFRNVGELKIGREFNPQSPTFLSTRSLCREYHIDKALMAFARFQKTTPNARLEIAGDGPEMGRLQKLAAKLAVSDSVVFHGRVSKNGLLALLEQADIYISVISTEGMSSSLLEAVAAGLLPIVYDMPASRIVVQDQVNGILLRDSEEETLVNALCDAVSQYRDMRNALEANACEIASHYDCERNLRLFLEKYEELIASKD